MRLEDSRPRRLWLNGTHVMVGVAITFVDYLSPYGKKRYEEQLSLCVFFILIDIYVCILLPRLSLTYTAAETVMARRRLSTASPCGLYKFLEC